LDVGRARGESRLGRRQKTLEDTNCSNFCRDRGLTMPEVYLKSLKHKSLADLNSQLVGIDKLVHQKQPDMFEYKKKSKKKLLKFWTKG
jgi:exonuclease I